MSVPPPGDTGGGGGEPPSPVGDIFQGFPPQYETLNLLLAKSRIVERLMRDSSWTLFAPSDAAWRVTLDALGLSPAVLLSNPEVLTAILQRHIVPTALKGADLKPGAELRTLEGTRLKVKQPKRPGAALSVGGAPLGATDVYKGRGGVVHLVDAVILPEELTARRYALTLPGVPVTGYFDPLNFTLGQTMNEIKRLREAEVTHGRVAMTASVGLLTQDYWRPLFPDIEGPAIIHTQQVPSPYWLYLIGFIAAIEYARARVGWEPPVNALFKLRDEYEPGDLSFDPLQLKSFFRRGIRGASDAELMYGRTAMLAVVVLVVEEVLYAEPALTLTRHALMGPG